MNKMVVTMRITNLLGLSMKNSGHFGLIIPSTKKSIVNIPRLIAASIMYIYLLNFCLGGLSLL